MRVNEVLASKGSSTVYTIAPDATVDALMDMLAEHNVGALVVSDDGTTMLGIVSERDIVRKLRRIDNALSVPVSQIMTTDVSVCSPDDSFSSLMTTMTDQRVRHVPVLQDGQLVGVLSIGDAVKHRMEQLEFERDQLNNYVAGG
ncbi:CBS domain-containing protein [Aeromicrobium sp. UC242_57]|uniref:CBS domain-containing protein n=1 Tax=Aeromicrobium sp. UC242_57 TaxID=3374624 RepID=UPI0037BB9AC7